LIFPQVFSHVDTFRSFAQQAMGQRVEKYKLEKQSGVAERKDFFYWLTNAKGPDDGPGYNMTELALEARTLIIAGSDTSAITLAAACFYLCRNPTVLEKLQNELRSTFTNFDSIRPGPKMNSCVYLRAVIDETLRTTPPVPSSLAREVQAGGITIEGEYLPEGTILGSSSYCLHHNPDNYPNSFAFVPERWIVSEETGVTAKDVAAAKSAFMPFSWGSRGCLGKPMAYAEISMALGKVLWRYDIRLKPGDRTGEASNGQFALRDVFVSERDGPLVEFKRVQ
jgi:cytochrome P450